MSQISIHNESSIATVHSSNANVVTEAVKHLASILHILAPKEQLRMIVRLESFLSWHEHVRYLAVVSSRRQEQRKVQSPSEAFLNPIGSPQLNESPEEFCVLGIDVPVTTLPPVTRTSSPLRTSAPGSPQKTHRSNSSISPEQHQGIGSRIASRTRKFLTLPKQKSHTKNANQALSSRLTTKRPSITSSFKLDELPKETDDSVAKVQIGLVVPIYEDTKITLDGDGGFRIENGDRQHTFKPMSVQAMWSILQTLLKASENAKRHHQVPPGSTALASSHRVSSLISTTTTTVFNSKDHTTDQSVLTETTSTFSTCYESASTCSTSALNIASHAWIEDYVKKIDSKWINEWHLPFDDLVSSVEHATESGNRRPLSPLMSRHRQREYSDTEKRIRNSLRDVMFKVDLEQVNSKEIRKRVEEKLQTDLSAHKSFIDHEILVILGQMDSASQIFDYLYLGTEWNASNLEELQEKKIGLVLNVTTEITNSFPQSFDYRNIRVNDEENEIMLHHWEEAIRHISEAKKDGKRVLVHCKMGVSRSASVVIAYVMKANDWTLDESLKFVKERRNCIQPNPGFMRQLEVYQGILEASKHRSSWQSASSSGSTLSLCDTTTKPSKYSLSELDAISPSISSNLRRASSSFFSAPNLSPSLSRSVERSESLKLSSRPATFYVGSSNGKTSSTFRSKRDKKKLKCEPIDEVSHKDDSSNSPTDDTFGMMRIVCESENSSSSTQIKTRSTSLSSNSHPGMKNLLNQLKTTPRVGKPRGQLHSVPSSAATAPTVKENKYVLKNRPASIHVSTYLKPKDPVQTLVKYFDELTATSPAAQPQAAQV